MKEESLIEKCCLHATVEGHVQGVGFRLYVQRAAVSLELTGWVRNRWNGDVEVWAEGARTELDKLLSNLYNGPRSAFVSNVKYEWKPATEEFINFQVRVTG